MAFNTTGARCTKDTMKANKTGAILYDFLQVRGGAEAVTLGLCHHFQNLDLVTGFVNPSAFPSVPIESRRLKTLTRPTSLAGWQTLKTCFAFEHNASWLKDYDTLIFSGSNAPLAIKNSQAKKHIYYCHTPPRFVYDLKDYYLDAVPLWQKPLLKSLIAFLQPRYEESIGKMDVVFANSRNVQRRLKKYLNVDAQVLYPPCKTDRFKWGGQGGYFLSTARVEEYKRVELIVRAFMRMPDRKLVVTSGGSQLEKLKRLASGYNNIEFTGWVSEERLADLVGNCVATIYIPKDEDFGMSPVESMGAGKPVIGVNEGGVKETVIPGETGWLLPENPVLTDLMGLVSEIDSQTTLKLKSKCEATVGTFGGTFYSAMSKEISEW